MTRRSRRRRLRRRIRSWAFAKRSNVFFYLRYLRHLRPILLFLLVLGFFAKRSNIFYSRSFAVIRGLRFSLSLSVFIRVHPCPMSISLFREAIKDFYSRFKWFLKSGSILTRRSSRRRFLFYPCPLYFPLPDAPRLLKALI